MRKGKVSSAFSTPLAAQGHQTQRHRQTHLGCCAGAREGYRRGHDSAWVLQVGGPDLRSQHSVPAVLLRVSTGGVLSVL